MSFRLTMFYNGMINNHMKERFLPTQVTEANKVNVLLSTNMVFCKRLFLLNDTILLFPLTF